MSDAGEKVQWAIYTLCKQTYLGSILQCMRIYESDRLPTAGVFYDPKLKTISMSYNPKFVLGLTMPELKGVLIHEMEHIMRNHIFIYNTEQHRKDHKRFNFAMDLVINQYIPDTYSTPTNDKEEKKLIMTLPSFALQYKNFKDKTGKVFPPALSTEGYYDLLEDATYDGPTNPDGEGDGPGTLDQHFWDGIEEKEAMEGVTDLLKRSQNHYEKSHGTGCKEIADRLEAILSSLTNLNYKQILAAALRSSLPGNDIAKTWSRPSRRYKLLAKGNKHKPTPSVRFYGDTSGSMSYTEVNECVNICFDFIKAGIKEFMLNMFHEKLYLKNEKYKKGMKFKYESIECGGTELTEVLQDIADSGADLNIILTDGHYGRPPIPKELKNKTVFFLIKEGGNQDHPLKDIGKTLQYKVG